MTRSYNKSNQEIALLLLTRPAKTEAGRKVQATLLMRVESAIISADFVNEMNRAIAEEMAV